MARFLATALCLAMILALAACGGSGNVAPPAGGDTGGGDNKQPPANQPDEGPREDPDLWKKVATPTPTGWKRLAKDGQDELRNNKYDLLLKPTFHLLAAFGDREIPHPSSGTDEEWQDWRDGVSAVFIYNVSKQKDDALESLKKHGAAFLNDFDAGAVRSQNGMALYVQPGAEQKWLACVSNERGTYILAALVRNDDAANLMKPYPATIKPE